MPGPINIINVVAVAEAAPGSVVSVNVIYGQNSDEAVGVEVKVLNGDTGLLMGSKWTRDVPPGSVNAIAIDITMIDSDLNGQVVVGYGQEIIVTSDTYDFAVGVLEVPEAPPGDGVPQVVEVEIPTLPWYASWLEPVLVNLNTIFANIVNYLFPTPNPFGGLIDAISDPVQAVLDKVTELFTDFATQSVETSTRIYEEAQSETPADISALQDQGSSISEGQQEDYAKALTDAFTVFAPETIKDAPVVMSALSNNALVTYMAKWGIAFVAEAASLGQLEAVLHLNTDMIRLMGVDQIASKAFMVPLEEAVFKKAQQFYASQYLSDLPDTNWLIQFVIKEKISVQDFINVMKFKGISEENSQLIWDSHFIAPNLGQLVTSYHRGTITFDELKQLTVLVDLDPYYYNWEGRGIDLWNDSFFRDPTIRQARYMFEAGAVNVDGVRSIVKRSGLYPQFVEPMTDYLITFEERLWRTNYLRQLGNLYGAGLRSKGELDAEVLATGRTIEVSNWIAASEDAQRELKESKVKITKPKLITLSIAQDAFIAGDVGETWLREYLDERGYEDDDVEIAFDVLKERKREALEPKPVRRVLLSQSYIQTAYLKDFIDEGYLRQYFRDKGYSEQDIEIAVRVLNQKKGGVS